MTSRRIIAASLLSAVVGLQIGSLSVVLQTLFSGKTALPWGTFILFMQPIHLAIGIMEGLVTAAVLAFIWKARPEIFDRSFEGKAFANSSMKKVIITLAIVTVFTGGVLSWVASSNPDGLEWSILKTAGISELESSGKVHDTPSDIQTKTAILPDYSIKTPEASDNASTSIAGLVGGIMTLALAGFSGFILTIIKRRKKKTVV